MASRDAKLKGKGYEKITGLSTAKSLTPPSGSAYALVKTETQPVRWRAYATGGVATDPTATDGMLLDVGDEFWFTGELTMVRLIETAVSATVHVHYFS